MWRVKGRPFHKIIVGAVGLFCCVQPAAALVDIGDGIKVQAEQAERFKALITDLKAHGLIVKFAGGWRRGACAWPRHKHPCGQAIDICQYARNVVDQRCHLPPNDITNAIARQYGLIHGGEWRAGDRGHFELASRHPEPFPAQTQIAAARIPPPVPAPVATPAPASVPASVSPPVPAPAPVLSPYQRAIQRLRTALHQAEASSDHSRSAIPAIEPTEPTDDLATGSIRAETENVGGTASQNNMGTIVLLAYLAAFIGIAGEAVAALRRRGNRRDPRLAY
jgi:hypothetical protein